MGVVFTAGANSTPPAGTEVEVGSAVGDGERQVVAIGDQGTGTDMLVINADGSINVSGGSSADPETLVAVISGLTTASTAYSIGDQLGNIMELTNAAAASGGHGYISSLTLLSDTAPTSISSPRMGPVEAWFFSESVTLAADNAAFSLSDADAAKCIGVRTFAAPSGAANNELATLAGVSLDYECAATSLFVALKTLAGLTVFTAADDLHITARVMRL